MNFYYCIFSVAFLEEEKKMPKMAKNGQKLPKKNQLIYRVFFWLVIPKKLKYEKIFKYGTGHLENFLSPSTFMKVDTLTFFHHF